MVYAILSDRGRRIAWVALILVVAGAAADLFLPQRSSLRRFDADEVARLETTMWRAYYERREVALFRDMTTLLRREYHMPPLRATVAAFHAARAAFVFKRGRKRADYERALPSLRRYYSMLEQISDSRFDVARVAQLELEWWIVHRERHLHDPSDLPRALAELQAAIYRLDAARFAEHARLRAEAMTLRDDTAAATGVSNADWARIEELLRGSFRALYTTVNRS